MACTFISYRERDVEVPEEPLICMGYMLFNEACINASTPGDRARLEQMNRDWHKRATQCGVGCADLGLDLLLGGDPQKERELLSFVRLARDRLRSFGDAIPAEYVDQVIAAGIPEYKGAPLKSAWFHRVLDIIEALIRGEPAKHLGLGSGS